MALFGRDYDRDYGYYGGRDREPGRYYRGRWTSYDRDYGYGAAPGYARDYGYKSRWRTDYGDPFGDRISHTPVRLIRGEFHRGYGSEYGAGEGRYRSGGTEREPYEPGGYSGTRWNRPPMWNRGPERGYRGYGGYGMSRYDRDWY